MDRHAPVETAHGTILREPKGGPDVTLLGGDGCVDILTSAANILSVQGWTARIVRLDVPLTALPQQERARLVAADVPYLYLDETEPQDAASLAKTALEAIRR